MQNKNLGTNVSTKIKFKKEQNHTIIFFELPMISNAFFIGGRIKTNVFLGFLGAFIKKMYSRKHF